MTEQRLRRFRSLQKEKRHLEECIEELDASMLVPKVQKLTGMPSGGHDDHAMDSLVAKYDELVQKYVAKLVSIMDEQAAVEDAFDKLDSTEQALMRALYVRGMTWREVEIAFGYNRKKIQRVHTSAMKKLNPGE